MSYVTPRYVIARSISLNPAGEDQHAPPSNEIRVLIRAGEQIRIQQDILRWYIESRIKHVQNVSLGRAYLTARK